MTDDSEVARVAEGLTKAQQEQVLLWEAEDFASASRARQRLSISVREGIRPLVVLGIATKPVLSRRKPSKLTPLGIAVRSYLQSKGGGA